MGESETVDGSAASSVIETSSANVNREAVPVIFDGSSAIVNGEVAIASEEG